VLNMLYGFLLTFGKQSFHWNICTQTIM
jgi:hypothetical protein